MRGTGLSSRTATRTCSTTIINIMLIICVLLVWMHGTRLSSRTATRTCSTTHTLRTMKLQMKSAGFHTRSPSGPSVGSGSIQVSPAAMRKSVTKARLNLPNWSGATSAKSDTPRMESAGRGGAGRGASTRGNHQSPAITHRQPSQSTGAGGLGGAPGAAGSGGGGRAHRCRGRR
jgi:hypothetical protein